MKLIPRLKAEMLVTKVSDRQGDPVGGSIIIQFQNIGFCSFKGVEL